MPMVSLIDDDVHPAGKKAVEGMENTWAGKVVGMRLSAGLRGRYLSAIRLANSLEADVRWRFTSRFIDNASQ